MVIATRWDVGSFAVLFGKPNGKQVAVLDLAYFITFGSELAVVSMLPLFFFETDQANPV